MLDSKNCQHTNREGIYLLVAFTSTMFLICVIEFPTFNSTKNKASANAIHYVVLPLFVAIPKLSEQAQKEFATANLQIKHDICKHIWENL